jgi:two-component system nitrogen regulation response regulator NtrX
MKPRVLIVDDEANIRRMLAALLKSEGFETEEAPNGNAALLQLDQLHPDSILLDLQMPPGPDGLETLRQIRERDAWIPVIMMSGKAQLTDAVQAIKQGAFTGATDRRLGRFELADGGTLFLDEVGDLNLEAQAKLLRVLEAGEIQRLGAERTQRVDVRVVAATNQRLQQAVSVGSFREDLYFRLAVFPLELAPLRERLDDLPDLVLHLAERVRPHQPARFTADALAMLGSYDWPGNVRELANVVERLSILGGSEIDAALVRQVLPRAGSLRFDAPAVTTDSGTTYSVADLGGRSLSNVLDDYERALIGAALKRAAGNVAEAARALQTDRANLYRRMKRLGL